MIYRLATGAQSAWKRYLISGLFVFMVTAGFPVLAAWLNYENLTLNPTEISQGGEVLGDSTTPAPPAATNESSRQITVTPTTPVTKPIKPTSSQHHQQPAASPTVTPAPPAASVSAEVDESAAEADLNVLDVVEAEVEVSPNVLLDQLGL